MDLAEAPRIVGGGAGLCAPTTSRPASTSSPPSATALGASMGATRVVTDRGWVGHDRQIGTTGVVVDPEPLPGVRHLAARCSTPPGSATPTTSSSVNLDPNCPMMAMADLAVVADANAIARRAGSACLGVDGGDAGRGRRG